MKALKILAILALVYAGIVATFESLLGYFQPQNQSTLTITTLDPDGTSHDRVLAKLDSGGLLYVAVNHWPRAWYQRALENPNVRVTIDGVAADYTAVPVDDAEHDRVNSDNPLGTGFRILTGFPPRCFLRLDPVVTPPELITRTLLFGNPERYQGRLSPDGLSMSFLAPLDGVMNVWVAPAGAFDLARAVTQDTGRGISNHFWALDSQHVIYMQDQGGDENWHLYSVNLASNAIIDLSPYEGVQAQMIEQSPERPGVAIIGMNDRDPRWHDVYAVDLATAKRTLLLKNDGYGIVLVDNALAVRLALKQTPAGGFEVFERRKNAWAPLFEIPAEDALTSNIISFDTDNKGIYLLDSRGRDYAALVHLTLATGEIRELAAPADMDVADVIVDPRTHAPLAYATNVHTRRWVALAPEFADDIEALNNATTGDARVLSTTLDASKWIVFLDTSNASPVYAVFDRDTRSLDTLFVTNTKLDGLPLVPMHGVTIPSRDGLSLVSFLTLPMEADPDADGVADSSAPLVLLVHGGPWGRDEFGYSGLVQWLANRGYAVLQINFRASTGFGKAFVNAGNREWAAAMHNDLLDGVEWAINQGITTRDQVGIMGASYGGYATLVGLAFTPDVFQCGVDIVGPSNLNTLLSSIPPYWEGLKQTFVVAIGDPETEEGQALLASRSPLNFAGDIKRPLLIGQGANDPRVKQAESDQIVAKMNDKGIPVTYILYPDEGHGFQRPENNLSFFAASEAFLSECLQGRFQPIGDDFNGSSIQILQGKEFIPGL